MITNPSIIVDCVVDEPIPPPASYNFDIDSCQDPFGTKSKVANSPTGALPVPPAVDIDYENMADPFGTKSNVSLINS